MAHPTENSQENPPPLPPGGQSDGANPQLIFKVDRYLGFSLDLLFPIATSLLSCPLLRRQEFNETRAQNGVKSHTKSDKRVVM